MTIEAPRPKFLASVTSPEEALIALAGGADIIDAKNPAEGALGALPIDTVRAIRKSLPPHVTLSATIGDVPCKAAVVVRAVKTMASSGCNLIKIGFFPGGDARAVIAALGGLDLANVRLVGLLLADRNPDFTLLRAFAEAGFAGVMVDTEGKIGTSLTDHIAPVRLGQFVREAHEANLFAGIAGSLRLSHLPRLLPLKPDIVGFRGALCRSGDRIGAIDQARVRAVHLAFEGDLASHEHGAATAAS